MKDVVPSSVSAPKFDKKHLKIAGGHISQNFEYESLKTLNDKKYLYNIFLTKSA